MSEYKRDGSNISNWDISYDVRQFDMSIEVRIGTGNDDNLTVATVLAKVGETYEICIGKSSITIEGLRLEENPKSQTP